MDAAPVRRLAGFRGVGYDKGRSRVVQVAWFACLNLVFCTWWCPPRVRVALLRWFGADIGRGVLIRHRVRVHWPWKLSIGDHSWVGEGAWILNLEPVHIGSDTVISQEAMLCTGSHDRHSATFEFDNAPISIGDGAWVATRAVILRGVVIGDRATIGAGAVVSTSVAPGHIVTANGSCRMDTGRGHAP
ncbi:DapH/DapD/GlmU-related protein [Williamsia sp. MIQD14]|uniref:DapH/DapD/GlmU-related protein n=1 Tax=Williamsia sp. MIQD14 TaxID=3425703 RepID=UPI003DA05A80